MTVTLRAKLQSLIERGNTAIQTTDAEGAMSLKDTLTGLLGDFEAVQARASLLLVNVLSKSMASVLLFASPIFTFIVSTLTLF